MATTNNRSWKALLPRNGGIGVCPQIGRVKIPPVCPITPEFLRTFGFRP